MSQLKMEDSCCGSGPKSSNYAIKFLPGTTVEEKVLLIGAAFLIVSSQFFSLFYR
jgi:hypothetical protein